MSLSQVSQSYPRKPSKLLWHKQVITHLYQVS